MINYISKNNAKKLFLSASIFSLLATQVVEASSRTLVQDEGDVNKNTQSSISKGALEISGLEAIQDPDKKKAIATNATVFFTNDMSTYIQATIIRALERLTIEQINVLAANATAFFTQTIEVIQGIPVITTHSLVPIIHAVKPLTIEQIDAISSNAGYYFTDRMKEFDKANTISILARLNAEKIISYAQEKRQMPVEK